MLATAVTLANGRTLNVAGEYDDVRAYLGARGANGRREVKLTDGRRVEVAVDAIVAVEERVEQARRRVGFA